MPIFSKACTQYKLRKIEMEANALLFVIVVFVVDSCFVLQAKQQETEQMTQESPAAARPHC